MTLHRILVVFVLIFISASLAASPIYVYIEADGTKRFTSKKPPKSYDATLYTSKAKFARYSPISRQSKYRIAVHPSHKKFDQIIDNASSRYGLGQNLIKAVIHTESAFNPKARSPKGAEGLMQLMPFNSKKYGVKNSFSPEENIQAGARMLARLLNKYSGDLRLALAAYNAGEGAVKKYGGIPPYAETEQYVRKVIRLKSVY